MMKTNNVVKIRYMSNRNIAAFFCCFATLGLQYNVLAHVYEVADLSGPPTLESWIIYFGIVFCGYGCLLRTVVLTPEGIIYPRWMGLKRELIPWKDFRYRACTNEEYDKRYIDDTVFYYTMYYAKKKCKMHVWFKWINPFSGCEIPITPSIADYLIECDDENRQYITGLIANQKDVLLKISYEDGAQKYIEYIRKSYIYQGTVLLFSLFIMLYETYFVVPITIVCVAVIVLGFLESLYDDHKHIHQYREAYYHEVIRKAGL